MTAKKWLDSIEKQKRRSNLKERDRQTDGHPDRPTESIVDNNGAVKCRLICRFRGQALLLRVLHVIACDNVRDCVFLKDDLNRVKKGFNS